MNNYKIIFFIMNALVYVGIFWVLPIFMNDNEYITSVIMCHAVVLTILVIAGLFAYVASKAGL